MNYHLPIIRLFGAIWLGTLSPCLPVIAQSLDLRGAVTLTPRTAVAAVGDLCVAVGNNHFACISLADPDHPQVVGQSTPGVSTLASVDIFGNYACCAGGVSGLISFNVSNPGSPQWISSLPLAGSANDADAYDTLVVVATSANVTLAGVRSPQTPHVLATHGRAATWIEYEPVSRMVYCGSNDGAFSLRVNHSFQGDDTVYSLTLIDEYGDGIFSPLDISGDYVDVAHGAQLAALSRTTMELAGSYEAPAQIRAVKGKTGVVFIALGTAAVQYLDHRTATPEFLDAAGVPSAASGLAVTSPGGIPLLIVSHNSGVSVFEYTVLSAPPGSPPAVASSLSLSAFPNPFNSTVNLEISTAVPGLYTTELFDLQGRVVYSGEQFISGTVAQSLSLSGQAAGVYFASVAGGNSRTTAKLLYLP